MNYFEILKKITGVSFITSILAFLTSFLISIFSTKEDFANYTIYISLIGLVINVIPFGLCMLLTVSRYTVEPAVYFNYMRTGFLVVSPIVLLVILLILPLSEKVALFNLSKSNIVAIIFISYFNTINLAVISYLRVSQSFNKYSLFLIAYTFNNTFLIFIGLLILKSFTSALYLSLFSSMLLACFSVTNGAQLHRVNFGALAFFRPSEVIKMVKYGAPIVLSTTTMSFLVVGDKLIFGSLNEVDFPKYAIASLVASTSLFLVNNFASSWGAYLSKKLADKTLMQRRTFCFSKARMLLTVLPISFCVLLGQLLIYKAFYESEFPGLYTTITILSLAYSLFGSSKFFMGFINFEKKNFYLFISSLSGVIVIVALSLFYKDIQLNDMALILITGMFFQFIFCLFITKNIYGVDKCSTA